MADLYRVRVVRYCKRNEVIVSYDAPTHPITHDSVYYQGVRYIVACVSHVVGITDPGTYNESRKLNFVEVEVME